MVLKERLRSVDMTILAIVIGYALIIYIPIYNYVVVKGQFFGNDVAQYLLTARCLIEGKENLFKYPYLLVPLLYIIPTLVIRDLLDLYAFALFVSGLLITMTVCVMYYLLKNFIEKPIARILSTLFFGTFPLTLDIIGWGGQSTLMALFLGLSSIAFMTNYYYHAVYSTKRKKLITLSSLTLLLSTLTEPYISIYFIVTLGLLILWEVKCCNLKKLLKEAILLVPSLLVIAFILFDGMNVHEKILTTSLLIYFVIEPSILNRLMSRFTFDYFLLYFALIAVISAYLALKLHLKFRSVDNHSHILALTAIALLVQVLITPAQYADRGLFLSSIPITIMLGKVMDYVMLHDINKQNSKLIALVALLLTLLVPGIGIDIYNNALGFYFVDKDLLSNISFIRYEEGNVLYISPHPWSFSLAYITDKDVYPTTQPVWFIRKSQVDASILAMSLAWGIRWIDAGEIKVVDSTPIWVQPSPAIYVAKYPYYVELFRLGDGFMPIVFSPTNNESMIWYESPFYAKEIKAWNTNISMFSVYRYDFLTIEKIINVDNSGAVNILLNYDFINSFPREIKLRLVSLMLKDTRAFIVFNNDTYAQIKLIQSFEEPWLKYYYHTTVEVYVLSSDITTAAEFIERDEWGLPELAVTFKPLIRVSNVTVLLKVKVDNVNIRPPRVVTEDKAIKDANIRWVIISTDSHPDIIQRFERDPLYEKHVNLQKYVIFKVKTK